MNRPVIDGVIAIALLSVMDAIIKKLVATIPVLEVAFLRYGVGSVAMTAVLAATRPGWPRAETVRANALRAILVVVAAVAFFYALGVLPLAETLILSFVSPLFTALLATALLGERLRLRTLGAIAAGFAGVLVIVGGKGGLPGSARPGAAFPLLGIGAVLLSAVAYSASNVLLRARAQRDPVLHIVLIQNIAPAAILAGPASLNWAAPTGREALLTLAVGLLGVSGHLLLARAYANAEASRLAPLDYTALIWAAGIGFLVYAEVPAPSAILGAGLIGAGAWVGSRRG